MVYQGYGGKNNPGSGSGDQNRKIFLGGLSYHTTDETLRTFCSRFGKITDCLVMRNPEGKSRGFGFVTYEDTASVEEFMRSRPHTIDNRQIDPKRAMPREEQNSSEAHLTVKKLFVAGLRDGIDENSLQQHFSRFGNVVEILVMKDRDGKPRGFAFVTFDDYDAVDKAVLEKPHIINGRSLDVKKAVPKEKMQEGPSGNPASGGASMPPFNRNNPSNYPGSNAGPPPPSAPSTARGNYGPARDNYNNPSGSWDNQGDMSRMSNQNYNQQPASSYGPQGGYNTNTSGFNAPMPPTNTYPSAYNSMGQSQPPPPPPPPLPQQPAMMNYDMYNSNTSNSNMGYNNAANPPSNSNYMQAPPVAYGQNQQQGFGNNPSSFGGMNDPFNAQQGSASGGRGYSNPSSTTSPYDSSSSYGITSQNYGSGNYSAMPQQPSRGGGGPMRGGRGGGNGGSYGGSSGGDTGMGGRPAPYSTRGGRGGRGGGRGRGRGQ